MKNVGMNIKKRRIELGITLKRLETMSNINVSNLSRVERGLSVPRLPTLHAIAACLHCDIGALLK